MKKVIAAVVLTVAGMALALAILPGFGFEFGFLDAFRSRSTSYTIVDSFESVDVRGGDCGVNVYESYDGGCEVYIQEREDAVRSARVEDGTLVVSAQTPGHWYDSLFSGDRRYISVYLPEDVYSALTVYAEGDIYVSNETAFRSAELESDGGEVSVYAPVDGSAAITTSSGDVYLSAMRAGSLEIRSDSGDLSLNKVTVSGEVTLASGSGDIWLWDCDGSSFQIRSDSGDVSGTFLRPMDFAADTTGGSIDVPKPDPSGGTCAVTTGSGDIWLTVEE